MASFSIITPSYNRPHLLQNLIGSVKSQTYTDWQLIIVDDSTDNRTEHLITTYLDDARIIYIKNETNIGAPASRNRALNIATGDWVTLLDDDDVFISDSALAVVAEKIQSTAESWLVFQRLDQTGTSLTLQNKKLPRYNWTRDSLFGNSFRGDAAHFIKRSFVGEIRNYGAGRSEWQFWYQLAEKGDFVYLPLPVQSGGYQADGLMTTYVGRYQRLYLWQQLLVTLQPKNLRYLPIACLRYLLTISGIQAIRQKLRQKSTG